MCSMQGKRASTQELEDTELICTLNEKKWNDTFTP